jgi:ABC-type Zn uptake system ZnuABC Zn-binding protein ZnuA
MRRSGSRWLSVAVAVLVVATFALVACGEDDPAAAGDDGDRLRVITDVAPITSIVENIGGDRIALRGMVPRGVSSHGYEPPPADAQILSEADLFIYNGLWLAEPLYDLTDSLKHDDAVILWLGEEVLPEDEWVFDFDFPEEEGVPNPHVWMDPMRALRYAELVHGQLVALDPDNQTVYDANLERFREQTLDLHERIAQAVETIPPEHRKLLTYHDCCPYLAGRYDLEVIGAVQPSDFGEPSAREVGDIIDQVRELGLPAIFGSDLFPSPVMEQIGRETGAQFVYGIEDDELPGEPGDAEHTYWGMMLENALSIVEALGGDASPLDGFDPGPVFEGTSTARYD